MVSRAVLFAMVGDGGMRMVAATPVLDGDLDDVERRADARSAFPSSATGGAVIVSQMAFGQQLHGLVRRATEMDRTAAAGVEQTLTAADAGDGRSALATRGLVCVCGGRLAGRMCTHAGQRACLGLCRSQEDRPTVVCDNAVAHGP